MSDILLPSAAKCITLTSNYLFYGSLTEVMLYLFNIS